MNLGKLFISLGIFFFVIGLSWILLPKIPGLKNFGHLPGDIVIKKENFSFYFPLLSSIVISLLLSGFFWLIQFLRK